MKIGIVMIIQWYNYSQFDFLFLREGTIRRVKYCSPFTAYMQGEIGYAPNLKA
ncbi:hypothetical protein [Halobacillus mangrovi]|uniref:hypothetical protein n=1 Tax=Halobacillus mangrovi TaxID=402384 RepID=UPI003D98B21D